MAAGVELKWAKAYNSFLTDASRDISFLIHVLIVLRFRRRKVCNITAQAAVHGVSLSVCSTNSGDWRVMNISDARHCGLVERGPSEPHTDFTQSVGNGSAERKLTMKETIASLAVLTAGLLLSGAPNALGAQDGACSNATLKGAYGFFTGATILPDKTPRGTIGRWNFDGSGHFTANLTINDNGNVIHVNDAGTYTIAADCTGTIFPGVGGGTIEIVLVDTGNEFYLLRTAPNSIVLMFSLARKQFPGEEQNQAGRAH